MRKPELAAAIAEKADLTKDQANRVLNAVLEEITGALNRKDSVTLVGFGTFTVSKRAARIARNPRTGAEIRIMPLIHPDQAFGCGTVVFATITMFAPSRAARR